VEEAGGKQVVLIVEDEAFVCMNAVDMVEEAGFEVIEAANADMLGSMNGVKLAEPSEVDGRPSRSSQRRDTTPFKKANFRREAGSFRSPRPCRKSRSSSKTSSVEKHHIAGEGPPRRFA
jgi:hypothetical protein